MTDGETVSDELSPSTNTSLDHWSNDYYPLDIGLYDFTSIKLPPLIWSESDRIPLLMTIRNTGFMPYTEVAKSRATPTVLYGICSYTIIGPYFHDGTIKGPKYLEMLEEVKIILNNNDIFRDKRIIWQIFCAIFGHLCTRDLNSVDVFAEYAIGQRPMLTGSILRCPYEFWCFHFHWGAKNDEGSEHSVLGIRFPLEIHLVFTNISCKNTDEALDSDDGLLILVYLCKLRHDENIIFNDLILNLKKIRNPGKSTKINSFSLSSLFDCKLKNYLMYWGCSNDNEHTKPILWLISPKLVPINESQISRMRTLEWVNGGNVTSNCRSSEPAHRCKLFNVSSQATTNGLLRDLEDIVGISAPKSRDGFVFAFALTSAEDPKPERPTSPAVDSVKSKGDVIRSIDRLLSDLSVEDSPRDLADDVGLLIPTLTNEDFSNVTKKEYFTACNRPTITKTHREGVRMNSTALRRETHIKNRMQKLNTNTK